MSPINDLWQRAILPLDSTIEQAIRSLNEVGVRIVLVVDESLQLEGTISDGDIRRGLLKGLHLTSPIAEVVHRNALVVPPDIGRDLVIKMMVANKIQQIPIVNEDRRIVGLHLWDEITTPSTVPNLMVIMAGGVGTRLRPHTEACPKPLLPVAGRPMLEHILERAKAEGFSRFIMAIHYLGHMIEAHFGDGERFGVEIGYLREDSPLGTAGALALLKPCPEIPFVVTNGDVITDIRYGDLLDFHNRHNAAATMAVRVHEWQHPFGVVHTKGFNIVSFEEKPIARTHINAGVYVISPGALDVLDEGARCDMPTLFARLQAREGRTVAYPMHEPWLDVGRPDDLLFANSELANGAPADDR